ncbi:MAG: S-adenosylmethionine decarboxylase [candidate division NC10 bacterium]
MLQAEEADIINLMVGTHVKAVGRASPNLLRDTGLIERYLKGLCSAIDMRTISGPHTVVVEEALVERGADPFEDEGGVTSVLVLSTSHICIHTWPLRERLEVDCYSCRDFEPKVFAQVTMQFFDIAHEDLRYIVIGFG